jgi:hypothetical protein
MGATRRSCLRFQLSHELTMSCRWKSPRIPADLAESQGYVKVELDPHYNLIFPQIELLSALLVMLALLCTFPAIRQQASQLRRPFFIMLIASLGMSLLGYMGLTLIRPSPFAGWHWLTVQICFLFIVIGPIAFVLSVVSWLVASLIAYFRSHRAERSP